VCGSSISGCQPTPGDFSEFCPAGLSVLRRLLFQFYAGIPPPLWILAVHQCHSLGMNLDLVSMEFSHWFESFLHACVTTRRDSLVYYQLSLLLPQFSFSTQIFSQSRHSGCLSPKVELKLFHTVTGILPPSLLVTLNLYAGPPIRYDDSGGNPCTEPPPLSIFYRVLFLCVLCPPSNGPILPASYAKSPFSSRSHSTPQAPAPTRPLTTDCPVRTIGTR